MNPFVIALIVFVFFLGAFVLLVIALHDKQKQDAVDEVNYQEEKIRILREIEAKRQKDGKETAKAISLKKPQKTEQAAPLKIQLSKAQNNKPVSQDVDDDLHYGRNSFIQSSSRVDDSPAYHNHCNPEPTRSNSNSYSCPASDNSSSYTSDSSSGGGSGD